MSGKILWLSWGVPPEVTGQSTVVESLAKQFRPEEMIIAGQKPYNRGPLQWDARWPEIVYVRWAWPLPNRGHRWWRRVQFPWMLASCIWLVLRHRVHSIVTVFPDEHFLLAGYLTARLTRRQFFPYFHNLYCDHRIGLRRRFAEWLQARVFRDASHVFTMSDGMSELFRRRYPDLKQSPLLHSFSEPLPPADLPDHVHCPLRLMICGNINHLCEDAALRFAEAIAGCRDVQLSLTTGTSPEYLRGIGLLREGVECATVARQEMLRRLREADVVLLPHGLSGPWSADEFRTIFPTKTVEYLISGCPILAHTPPDTFITRFLRENECALIVERPDVGALREAIERLRTDFALRRRLVQNALKTAERFQATRVAAELRAWVIEGSDG